MTRCELIRLWPKSASDTGAAQHFLTLDRAALGPVVPHMVEWLKTSGPVRDVFVECLSIFNEDAIEPISDALRDSHEGRVVLLLRDVLPSWRREEIALLSDDVERLLQRGSLDGIPIHALALLHRARIVTHAPLAEWVSLFRRRLEEQSAILQSVEASEED